MVVDYVCGHMSVASLVPVPNLGKWVGLWAFDEETVPNHHVEH